MTTLASYVGLRQRHRADGSPFLAGIADVEFVVPAGARVLLQRVRPHDTDDGPAFVLVVAPPDPRGMTKAAQARACIDNAPAHRTDPRDAGSTEAAPC
jgi:hypothetical protein